jgi:hypothetical protein
MKKRKIICLTLFAALLTASALSVGAEEEFSAYNFFDGYVKEVQPYIGADGNAVDDWNYVLTEDENGETVQFLVTGDTYRVYRNEIKADASFMGFYDPNGVAPMIFPPRYEAEVIAVNRKPGTKIKADRFDENLVSYDGQLKLRIGQDTEVVTQDGEPFEGGFADRRLVVVYDVETRSMPPQTTPRKVVVLYEKAQLLHDGMLSANPLFVSVNGRPVASDVPPYIKEDGTVMVPFRAIAEAFGFAIGWDDATESVTLNRLVSFSVGTDNYTYLRTAPIQLGAAPELTNDRTFVPLAFFGKVLPVNDAYVNEYNEIVIVEN